MKRIIDFILQGISFYICILLLVCMYVLGWILSGTMLVIIGCCLIGALFYGLYEKTIKCKRK